MLEKSLFICYSNAHFSELSDIFLVSLKNIGVKNIKHLLHNFNNNFNNNFNQNEFQIYNVWYYNIINKLKYIITIINDYHSFTHVKYFIFSECNNIFIKDNINEWYNLEKDILEQDKDIYFMRHDSIISNDINSTFFIIKNNDNIKNIVQFFNEVLEIILKTEKKMVPVGGDQSIINSLKNKINYGYILNDYIKFNTNTYNKNKVLFHHSISGIFNNDKIIKKNNKIANNTIVNDKIANDKIANDKDIDFEMYEWFSEN